MLTSRVATRAPADSASSGDSIGAPTMSHRSCASAFFLDTFPFRPAPSAAKSALMASSAHSISWKVTTWATRGSPEGWYAWSKPKKIASARLMSAWRVRS